ncbi:unnamed protein product [Closterium sp. Yama58-4]|nr:unnamed protein product [Closterium sp. Yama58-4]
MESRIFGIQDGWREFTVPSSTRPTRSSSSAQNTSVALHPDALTCLGGGSVLQTRGVDSVQPNQRLLTWQIRSEIRQSHSVLVLKELFPNSSFPAAKPAPLVTGTSAAAVARQFSQRQGSHEVHLRFPAPLLPLAAFVVERNPEIADDGAFSEDAYNVDEDDEEDGEGFESGFFRASLYLLSSDGVIYSIDLGFGGLDSNSSALNGANGLGFRLDGASRFDTRPGGGTGTKPSEPSLLGNFSLGCLRSFQLPPNLVSRLGSGLTSIAAGLDTVCLGGGSGTVLAVPFHKLANTVVPVTGGSIKREASGGAGVAELREGEGAMARLWGMVAASRGASIAPVRSIQLLARGGQGLAAVAHADGVVRVWDVSRKVRVATATVTAEWGPGGVAAAAGAGQAHDGAWAIQQILLRPAPGPTRSANPPSSATTAAAATQSILVITTWGGRGERGAGERGTGGARPAAGEQEEGEREQQPVGERAVDEGEGGDQGLWIRDVRVLPAAGGGSGRGRRGRGGGEGAGDRKEVDVWMLLQEGRGREGTGTGTVPSAASAASANYHAVCLPVRCVPSDNNGSATATATATAAAVASSQQLPLPPSPLYAPISACQVAEQQLSASLGLSDSSRHQSFSPPPASSATVPAGAPASAPATATAAATALTASTLADMGDSSRASLVSALGLVPFLELSPVLCALPNASPAGEENGSSLAAGAGAAGGAGGAGGAGDAVNWSDVTEFCADALVARLLCPSALLEPAAAHLLTWLQHHHRHYHHHHQQQHHDQEFFSYGGQQNGTFGSSKPEDVARMSHDAVRQALLSYLLDRRPDLQVLPSLLGSSGGEPSDLVRLVDRWEHLAKQYLRAWAAVNAPVGLIATAGFGPGSGAGSGTGAIGLVRGCTVSLVQAPDVSMQINLWCSAVPAAARTAVSAARLVAAVSTAIPTGTPTGITTAGSAGAACGQRGSLGGSPLLLSPSVVRSLASARPASVGPGSGRLNVGGQGIQRPMEERQLAAVLGELASCLELIRGRVGRLVLLALPACLLSPSLQPADVFAHVAKFLEFGQLAPGSSGSVNRLRSAAREFVSQQNTEQRVFAVKLQAALGNLRDAAGGKWGGVLEVLELLVTSMDLGRLPEGASASGSQGAAATAATATAAAAAAAAAAAVEGQNGSGEIDDLPSSTLLLPSLFSPLELSHGLTLLLGSHLHLLLSLLPLLHFLHLSRSPFLLSPSDRSFLSRRLLPFTHSLLSSTLLLHTLSDSFAARSPEDDFSVDLLSLHIGGKGVADVDGDADMGLRLLEQSQYHVVKLLLDCVDRDAHFSNSLLALSRARTSGSAEPEASAARSFLLGFALVACAHVPADLPAWFQLSATSSSSSISQLSAGGNSKGQSVLLAGEGGGRDSAAREAMRAALVDRAVKCFFRAAEGVGAWVAGAGGGEGGEAGASMGEGGNPLQGLLEMFSGSANNSVGSTTGTVAAAVQPAANAAAAAAAAAAAPAATAAAAAATEARQRLRYYEAVMRLLQRYSEGPSAARFALAAIHEADAAFPEASHDERDEERHSQAAAVAAEEAGGVGAGAVGAGAVGTGAGAAGEVVRGVKGRLWANVFEYAVQGGQYDEAFCALASNPDPLTRSICLRQFVAVLLPAGPSAAWAAAQAAAAAEAARAGRALSTLCGRDLPYAAADLHVQVEQELMWLAENSDVALSLPLSTLASAPAATSAALGRVSPYKLLYSFHVARSDWRKAALAMYRYAWRLGREVLGSSSTGSNRTAPTPTPAAVSGSADRRRKQGVSPGFHQPSPGKLFSPVLKGSPGMTLGAERIPEVKLSAVRLREMSLAVAIQALELMVWEGRVAGGWEDGGEWAEERGGGGLERGESGQKGEVGRRDRRRRAIGPRHGAGGTGGSAEGACAGGRPITARHVSRDHCSAAG